MKLGSFAACRLALTALALIPMMSAPAGNAHGKSTPEAYPDHPIRLLIGLPPGGSADIVARIVAAKLSDTLGQQIAPWFETAFYLCGAIALFSTNLGILDYTSRLIADQPMKARLAEVAKHMQAAKGPEKAAKILAEVATKGSYNP